MSWLLPTLLTFAEATPVDNIDAFFQVSFADSERKDVLLLRADGSLTAHISGRVPGELLVCEGTYRYRDEGALWVEYQDNSPEGHTTCHNSSFELKLGGRALGELDRDTLPTRRLDRYMAPGQATVERLPR